MNRSAAPLRLLCLGQSHFGCVRDAAADAQDELAQAGVALTTLVMNQPHFEPHFNSAEDSGGPDALHPALQAEVLRLNAEADAVYVSVGGTAHCVLGLLEHPRPFDFVLEGDPAVPLLPGREPLPGGVVRAALTHTSLFRHQRALRRFLPALLMRPIAHIESPPPPPDGPLLMANLGGYGRKMTSAGVAPAPLRRKLWRLHSQLVADDCAEAGIEFVGTPPAVHDAEGYLRAEALLHGNPTHANAWYGRHLIEQIVRRHRPGFTLSL